MGVYSLIYVTDRVTSPDETLEKGSPWIIGYVVVRFSVFRRVGYLVPLYLSGGEIDFSEG